MIKKANGDIRVQAKDMCRVREIQRLLRNKYPYVSEKQIQLQAWKVFANERKTTTKE